MLRTRRWSLVLALFALMCGAFAGNAFANGTAGSFEVDGNLVDSPAGEPIDWSSPPPNLTSFTDATGKNDDAFGQGSKETAPSEWKCIKGSAPQKDDLLAGQIAFRTVAGKQWAYVNYTRKGVNGDAHIDYEFSQSNLANPACPDLPQRTAGDITVTFDTENGGAQIFVNAYRWISPTMFQQLPTGSEHVTWDGAVNIPNSIPGHTAGDFGEASLNLTDTIGTIACGQFSRAYMKTRSSTSITSALQDRTSAKPITVGDCPNSTLSKKVRNVTTNGTFNGTATAKPGDVIEYQLTYTNTGKVPATDVKITDTIQPRQTFVSCSQTPPCATNGPPVTQVSWTFASVPAGGTQIVTFQVRLDAAFPNGTTQVKNVGVVDTKEEEPKTSNETTVTVTSAPKSNLAKAVRNVTTNTPASPGYAAGVDANPGDTIEYRITYTNSGTSTANNVVISDPIPAKTTFVSCSQTPPCTTTGTPVTSVSWTFASVPPGESRVVTFRVVLDKTGWPAGTSTPVTNTAKVCTTEEGTTCTNSPPTVVTVKTPSSSLAKAVRILPGTVFSTNTTAQPGDTAEYRLTYTNNGPGTATNVVISDPIPDHTTFLSCSQTPPCTTTGTPVTSVSWTFASVAPGETKVVTFQVKLDSTFPAGTTEIRNIGTVCTEQEGCKNSPPVVIIVTGNPDLKLEKSADKTGTVIAGDEITYTLKYSNNGNASASNVVITEPIPAGTEFVSCSNSCTTNGPPVTQATWNIGTVAPGASSTVTLVVRVLNTAGCEICNVARIASPSQNNGTPVNSNQVCLAAQPGPNPAGANASGSALGASVLADLSPIITLDERLSEASSSQSGVGSDSDTAFLGLDPLPNPIAIPDDGSVLYVDVMRTTSTSTVSPQPAQARNVSTARTVGVNVLDGLVTADVVQAVSESVATGDSSRFSSVGSTFKNLKVNGVAMNDVAPNTTIGLGDITGLGLGVTVALREETGSTSGPSSTQLSGGTYAADLTVNMIHVHILDGNLLKGGKQPLDIIVSQAKSHADFPQTRLCKSGPIQSVSGHAFFASEHTDLTTPELLPVLVNYVDIPASGGNAFKQLTTANVPDDGSLLTATAVKSSSIGLNRSTDSSSSSYAEAANVCIKLTSFACDISAELVRSQSNSTATPTLRASNADGTKLIGLKIGPLEVPANPPPNTVLGIPGVAVIILNEQVRDAAQTGHTGLTVRAIRVILLDPPAGGDPGAEVIVSEAHSDATWR